MELAEFDDYGRISTVRVIPKPFVVCDACNARVGMKREDVGERGLPVGYAVIIADGHGGAFFYEVVCQKCRIKYFDGRPSFDTLEDAGINPTFSQGYEFDGFFRKPERHHSYYRQGEAGGG